MVFILLVIVLRLEDAVQPMHNFLHTPSGLNQRFGGGYGRSNGEGIDFTPTLIGLRIVRFDFGNMVFPRCCAVDRIPILHI